MLHLEISRDKGSFTSLANSTAGKGHVTVTGEDGTTPRFTKSSFEDSKAVTSENFYLMIQGLRPGLKPDDTPRYLKCGYCTNGQKEETSFQGGKAKLVSIP